MPGWDRPGELQPVAKKRPTADTAATMKEIGRMAMGMKSGRNPVEQDSGIEWIWRRRRERGTQKRVRRLLLPGALLVAVGAQLLAALMLVDLRLPAFLQ